MAVRVQLRSGPPITPLYTLYKYTHTSLATSALHRRQDTSPTAPSPANGGVSTTSATPPANSQSAQSPAPILISIISSPSNETSPTSASTPPSITTYSPSNNTTLPSATGAPSRTSSALSLSARPSAAAAAATPGPGSNADLSASHGAFTLMDIVPAFAVVGAVLLGVLVWLVYGCCTRKPRLRDLDDDGELICGPPYVNEYHYSHQTAYDGADDTEDIERAPRYHARSSTPGEKNYDYRWPALAQQPGFRAVERGGAGDREREGGAGFYVPPEYMGEDAPLISIARVAVPSSRSRTSTKVTNVRRSVGSSSRADSRAARYTSLSRDSSTSRMREGASGGSDGGREAAAKSVRREVWSDVRLDAEMEMEKKSEKERVKQRLRERVKEKQKEVEAADAESTNNTTWLSSLRNTIAEGSLRLIQGGRTGADKANANARERNPFIPAGVETDDGKVDSSEDNGNGIGDSRSGSAGHASRRRGHARTDSDVLVRLPSARTSGSGSGSLAMPMPKAIPKLIPEAHLPLVTPRGRRTYTRLRDEDEEDKFTPLPARLSESRSPTRDRSRGRGQSQSRSTSPRKGRSMRNNAAMDAVSNALMSPRHILPQSPPRVTSPPLESAMCFTPIPPLAAQLASPVARPAVRAGSRPRSNSRSRPRGYNLVDDHNRKSDWRHQPRANGMRTSKDSGTSTSTPWRHGTTRARAAETPTPTKIPGVVRRRDTVRSDEGDGRDKSTRARSRATRTASPPPPPPNVKSPRMVPPSTKDTEPSRAQTRPRVGRASASASSSNPHGTPSGFGSAMSASANPSANELHRNKLVRE